MKSILLILLLTYTNLASKDTQRTQVIMGTFASINLKSENSKEINKGFTLLKQIEKSLSSYDENALLYQLNKNKKVTSDKYLLEAIQKSQEFYQKSNSYFNITIGSITKKLYHFGEDEKLPTAKELQKAQLNINAIHIENKIITLDKNTTLDLGGMGKGFAVDKVTEYYHEQNITHGIIALSGDIQALHPINIYLNSPFTNQAFAKLQTLQVNTSISTSGTYRRYVKNKEHHHLINPKTKKQGKSFVSITLITKQNNTFIDAMATAIGVMPTKEALHFLVNHSYIGYILVRPNGNVIYGNLEKLCVVTWIK